LAAVASATRSGAKALCGQTSTPYTPLEDLGGGLYRGYQGGLYPGGSDAPPASYLSQGLAYSQNVQPLDQSGRPSAWRGRIAVLSIGMSNAELEFGAFQQLARSAGINPHVALVNGAEAGQPAQVIRNASAAYWQDVDSTLRSSGLTAAQVQVVWLKEAREFETLRFPADALALRSDLSAIVAILRSRFPNLEFVYVSSRSYAGYASTILNPEPYAYESGFAVKWLVEDRIGGQLSGRPWIGWGPYLWTNGTKGRSDGLVWTCADVQSDGTHPTASGQAKIARLLLAALSSDPTSRPWFSR